ncbi:MAG: NUDIX hydrolase [Nitrososphaeria archaeon]
MEQSNFIHSLRNKRIKIKVIESKLPNGRAFRREVVEHPGAVVILPILDDRVILIRQFRTAVNSWVHELPAGTLDKLDETPEDCAKRELREETGFIAGKIKKLFKLYTSPGFCTEVIYAFLAKDLRRGISSPEETEFIQMLEVSLSEAIGLVLKDPVLDAKTALTLLYYERQIK